MPFRSGAAECGPGVGSTPGAGRGVGSGPEEHLASVLSGRVCRRYRPVPGWPRSPPEPRPRQPFEQGAGVAVLAPVLPIGFAARRDGLTARLELRPLFRGHGRHTGFPPFCTAGDARQLAGIPRLLGGTGIRRRRNEIQPVPVFALGHPTAVEAASPVWSRVSSRRNADGKPITVPSSDGTGNCYFVFAPSP